MAVLQLPSQPSQPSQPEHANQLAQAPTSASVPSPSDLPHDPETFADVSTPQKLDVSAPASQDILDTLARMLEHQRLARVHHLHYEIVHVARAVVPEIPVGCGRHPYFGAEVAMLDRMVPCAGGARADMTEFELIAQELCESCVTARDSNRCELAEVYDIHVAVVAAASLEAAYGLGDPLPPSTGLGSDEDGGSGSSEYSTNSLTHEQAQDILLATQWSVVSLVVEIRRDEPLRALAHAVAQLLIANEMGGTMLGLLWIGRRFSRFILRPVSKGVAPRVVLEANDQEGVLLERELGRVTTIEHLGKKPTMFRSASLAHDVQDTKHLKTLTQGCAKVNVEAAQVLVNYFYFAASMLAQLPVRRHSIDEMRANFAQFTDLSSLAPPLGMVTDHSSQPDDLHPQLTDVGSPSVNIGRYQKDYAATHTSASSKRQSGNILGKGALMRRYLDDLWKLPTDDEGQGHGDPPYPPSSSTMAMGEDSKDAQCTDRDAHNDDVVVASHPNSPSFAISVDADSTHNSNSDALASPPSRALPASASKISQTSHPVSQLIRPTRTDTVECDTCSDYERDPLSLAKFLIGPIWQTLVVMGVELEWVSRSEFDSLLVPNDGM